MDTLTSGAVPSPTTTTGGGGAGAKTANNKKECTRVALRRPSSLQILPPKTNSQPTPTGIFCLYETGDGRMVTSPVVRTLGKWYEASYLLPHEPFRQDLIEVDVLLQLHVANTEAWKLSNFFEYYAKRFVPSLHGHHSSEEEVFYPAIKKKVMIPDKTTADHRALIRLLDDLDVLRKEFIKLGGADTSEASMATFMPSLKAKWHELRVLMGPHLAEEEMQMVGPIKDVFSEKDIDALIQEIMKHEPITALRAFLPWIAFAMKRGWGNAEEIAKFEANLPLPLRVVNKHFWTPAFIKYHRGALDSMRKGSEKVLIAEKGNKWF